METQAILSIFQLLILFFSVVIHEVSHGYAALALGDPTAKIEGRLTLNPISHIDPFGSILLPLLLSISGSPFVVGYAKPVPYNPYMLRGGKWGPALVALSGPASNFLLAFLFGLLLRFDIFAGTSAALAQIVVLVNIVLGLFNAIPIPPLDGSKLLFALLSYQYSWVEEWMTRYQLMLVLFALFFLWPMIARFLPLLFWLFTGTSF